MGLIALGESIIGLGFFLPGQAAMLLASATLDSVPEFLILWAALTVGAITGNVITFELGRRVGPALRESKLIKKHGAAGWDKATALLLKHDRWALFVGRIIPFGLLQTVLPAVAGTTRMPYLRFLPPIAVGAACATALPLLAGIGVATGLKSATNLMLIILVGLLLVVVAVIAIRKLRANARANNCTTAGSPDADPVS
ncbi:DedA family protein [Nonomuraea angiospora]|uniref:DedA family protein n=1 Tax=Nonomuraea angiospora TaxID=46172 RepID=UPI003431CC4A